jgi:S1-C subfamily serine protease
LIGLSATAAVAVAVGAGSALAIQHGATGGGGATATSTTALSSAQIASKTDPALVDVTSTLGYQQATAKGTGIVMSSNGLILTNNHVINGATSVTVTDIGNGKTYTATVVGYDESHDIAVLRASGASGLTVANFGNSSAVSVGNAVVALGNAEGLDGTPSVAPGTVVALNQSITASDEGSGTSEQLSGLIQSNAGIQPGDSGGPLVNDHGQIIGVDTAASTGFTFNGAGGGGSTGGGSAGGGGFGNSGGGGSTGGGGFGSSGGGFGNSGGGSGGTGSGGTGSGGTGSGGTGSGGTGSAGTGSTTQGYTIPASQALSVAKQIEAGTESGSVHIGATAFLGVAINPSQGGFGQGVQIEGVTAGTAAANAGLAAGDVITSVAGHTVGTSTSIEQVLTSYHPGDKVSIAWTDTAGQSHTATVTLGTGPAA